MKLFVILVAVCGAVCLNGAYADGAENEQDVCYDGIVGFCDKSKEVESCSAKYSGFSHHLHHMQGYANVHLEKSFDYLLLGANFNQYKKDRPGFQKLFNGLSDRAWNNAIDLIKYITKRGGTHDFTVSKFCNFGVNPEVNEIKSLGIALDIEKCLAKETDKLDESAIINKNYDTGLSHFIEEKFTEQQSTTIRELAGHINDMQKIVSHPDTASLGIYLFDEYLAK